MSRLHLLIAVCVLAVVGVVGAILLLQPTEEDRWKTVQCDDEGALQRHLKQYPDGQYQQKAQRCLASVQQKRLSSVLGRGVFIKKQNADGLFDLHYAAAGNMQELARFLLSKGADVNAVTNSDYASLSATTKKELEALTNTSIYNAGKRYRETPLHFAARSNAQETVELLIEKGAAIDAKNVLGATPLYAAAGQDALATTKLLIEKSAAINAGNIYGNTPLHSAALSNSPGTTKLLASRDADVNVKNMFGNTPLHDAAARNNLAAAKELLAQGTDKNLQNNAGETPLELAEKANHAEIIQALR